MAEAALWKHHLSRRRRPKGNRRKSLFRPTNRYLLGSVWLLFWLPESFELSVELGLLLELGVD